MPKAAIVGIVVGLLLGAVLWLLAVQTVGPFWWGTLGLLAALVLEAAVGSIVGAIAGAGRDPGDEDDHVPTEPPLPGGPTR